MKTFLKSLVIALCCVSCITPFSVFAQVSTTMPENLSEAQQEKWNELTSSVPYTDDIVVYFYTGNNTLRWSYDFTYPTSSGGSSVRVNNFYYMNADGAISLSFNSLTINTTSSTSNIFYFIKKSGTLHVGSELLDSYFNLDFPVIDGCAPGTLYVLSNPYISSLVNTYITNVSNISSWAIYSFVDVSYYPLPSVCNSSTFDFAGERSGYRLDVVYDSGVSESYYSYTKYKQGYYGISSNGACQWQPVSDSMWHNYSSTVVLTSSCYTQLLNDLNSSGLEVNDVKGNQLLESGNSSSQSASSSVDSVTSALNTSAGNFENFESQFNDNLTSSLSGINLDSVQLGNSSDFVKTASWVKVQFDHILNSSGLFKTAISFVLIVGLALLLIGRRL